MGKIERRRRYRRVRRLWLKSARQYLDTHSKQLLSVRNEVTQRRIEINRLITLCLERLNDGRLALRGLKSKLKDARKVLDRLRCLDKIRNIIQKHFANKSFQGATGNLLSGECHQQEVFSIRYKAIQQRTFDQITYYNEEKVKLTRNITAIRNRLENLRQSLSDQENNTINANLFTLNEQQIRNVLFGEKNNSSQGKCPVSLAITSGQESTPSYNRVRQLWDQFQDNENGSPLPEFWFLPPPPESHPSWNMYIQEKTKLQGSGIS